MTATPWRIIFRHTGGPEVLKREDFTPGPPGATEIAVRITAIGVNFIDTYHRSGLYPLPLPSPLGQEAAGVVEAVGSDVTDYVPGDRVVWMGMGGYATHAVIPAVSAYKLDDAMSDEAAAALLLKGLTAWMLVEGVRPLTADMSVLVLAAAGGVGSILVPWAKSLGATVIAHAGSAEKAALAKAAGADHALSCDWDALPAAVREANHGKGVSLVLDGIGKDSWEASVGSVAPLGLIATYGNASGPVPPFAPLDLAKAGSIYVTRPGVFDWIRDPARRAVAWERLQTVVREGIVVPQIGQRLPLSQAAEAHRLLESRQTKGATILIPD